MKLSSTAMSEVATAAKPSRRLAKTLRRLTVALTISVAVALLLTTHWGGDWVVLFLRTILIGLSATTAFALFEVWPRKLPRWFQRWALQVIAVGVFMPMTTFLIYILSTGRGAPPFWEDADRLRGWM
ncbi:MAG TPA: hypothetical protein VN181_11615, partial [Thermoanaerobaculia bacterium]|nr:hypothetical protein [Thermoanaerobaculia bacterium]